MDSLYYKEAIDVINRNQAKTGGPSRKGAYAKLARLVDESVDVKSSDKTQFSQKEAKELSDLVLQIKSLEENLEGHIERLFVTRFAVGSVRLYHPAEITVPLPASYPKLPCDMKDGEAVKRYLLDKDKIKLFNQEVEEWKKTKDGKKYIEDVRKATEGSRPMHIEHSKPKPEEASGPNRPFDPNLRIRNYLLGGYEAFRQAWEFAKQNHLELDLLRNMNGAGGCFDGAGQIIQDWLMEKQYDIEQKQKGSKFDYNHYNNVIQKVLEQFPQVGNFEFKDSELAELQKAWEYAKEQITIDGKPLEPTEFFRTLGIILANDNVNENTQKMLKFLENPKEIPLTQTTQEDIVFLKTQTQQKIAEAKQEQRDAKTEIKEAKHDKVEAKDLLDTAKKEEKLAKRTDDKDLLAEAAKHKEQAERVKQEAKQREEDAKRALGEAKAKEAEVKRLEEHLKEEQAKLSKQEKQDVKVAVKPSSSPKESQTDFPTFTEFDKMEVPKKYQNKHKIDNKAGKLLYRLNDGKIFWKPVKGGTAKSVEQGREVAGAWVANHITGGAVPRSHLREVDTKLGIAQEFVHVTAFTPESIRTLNKTQVAQILAHLIADKATSNYDAHLDNYGLDEKGQVIGIDKGEAFRFFQRGNVGFKTPLGGVGPDSDEINLDQYGKLDINFYKQVFELVKQGKLEVDFDDPIVVSALQRCSALTLDDVKKMCSGYAQTNFKQKDKQEAFYAQVYERLQSMPQVLENFKAKVSPKQVIQKDEPKVSQVQNGPTGLTHPKPKVSDSRPLPIVTQPKVSDSRPLPTVTQPKVTQPKVPDKPLVPPAKSAVVKPVAARPDPLQTDITVFANSLKMISVQNRYDQGGEKKGFVSYYLKRQHGDRPRQIQELQNAVTKAANALTLLQGEFAYISPEAREKRLKDVLKDLDMACDKIENEMIKAKQKLKGTSRMENVLSLLRTEVVQMRKAAHFEPPKSKM